LDTRKLGGKNGLDVSIVGLGCNSFGRRVDEKGTRAVIDAAIDAGVTFFDTAEDYGGGDSEVFMGNALEGRRDKVFLATKFGHSHSHVDGKNKGSPENIRAALEISLRKLKTDHIDLYQQHRPDYDTPFAESMGALEALVAEGKIRYYGCSYLTGAEMQQAIAAANAEGLTGYVTAQNEWNMLRRGIEKDLVPVCEANGIGILPYYPIEMGVLTGRYKRGDKPAAGGRLAKRPEHLEKIDFDKLEKLSDYAGDHGHDLLTMAMSWLAAQPAIVSIISGASRPEHVSVNAKAADWKMTPENLAEIETILAG
jgi:aryl-alcohol dehydrogenase-like predicted oxidoreductase